MLVVVLEGSLKLPLSYTFVLPVSFVVVNHKIFKPNVFDCGKMRSSRTLEKGSMGERRVAKASDGFSPFDSAHSFVAVMIFDALSSHFQKTKGYKIILWDMLGNGINFRKRNDGEREVCVHIMQQSELMKCDRQPFPPKFPIAFDKLHSYDDFLRHCIVRSIVLDGNPCQTRGKAIRTRIGLLDADTIHGVIVLLQLLRKSRRLAELHSFSLISWSVAEVVSLEFFTLTNVQKFFQKAWFEPRFEFLRRTLWCLISTLNSNQCEADSWNCGGVDFGTGQRFVLFEATTAYIESNGHSFEYTV